MKAYIGEFEISINGHPYKGRKRITNSYGQQQFVNAYFFDARTKSENPLRAYIIYRDPITNNVKVEKGSNDIEDLFSSLTTMQDVPDEELRTQYCKMLLDYIEEHELDIDFSSENNKSLYVEDIIVKEAFPETEITRKK